MTKKIQLRTNLLLYNQNAGVSGAALSRVMKKTATPIREMITLRTVPKTEKNRTIGRMGKLALMNRPYTKTRRTAIVYHSPRMR